ncbi:MAG: RagB/SusD family nutrient uptake outer membrane protein [Bacteroidota bacterium]
MFDYKLLKTLFAFAVVSMVFSCTDLKVDEVDSRVTESATGEFTGNGPDLLASAYNDLSTFTAQENTYSLFTHSSDIMIPPTRGVDWGDNGVWRTLHAHTWDPTHSFVTEAWNILNQRAFKCNQVLASSDPAASAQEKAEAKFLRAFYMWNVMDLFGKVPFREVNEGIDVDPRVLTRSEAFDFIETDLMEAMPDLPDLGPSATIAQASKASANALLARLYLNKAVYTADNPGGPYKFEAADMDKVIEFCDKVTAAGFSLEANYFDNFSTDATTEIILTSAAGSAQNRYFMTLHYDQNPSGWNGFTTLADFYDKFEADDQRIGSYPPPDGSEFSGIGRGFLIGQQFTDAGDVLIDSRSQKPLQFTRDVPLSGAATDKGIRAIKYHPANQGNYILLRYADVFLMKAEAVLRGGTDPGGQTALQIVNELRTTRGASALGSVDEAAMLDERGRELWWEGIRRVDQVRFGTFSSTWDSKTNTDPTRVLFPIPQQALDSNPNLVQNDGY